MDLRGRGTSNKIYVSINDPSKGRVKMTLEEFAQSYSGICMMMNPSENFETGGEPASILEFAKQRLTGTLPMFLMITSTTLIAAMTNILLPAFSRFFVDYLLIMINYSPLLASVGILAVIINLTIAKIISDKRIDITRVQMRDTANLNITCKKSTTSLSGR